MTSKDIVKVLTQITDAGHEIVSCDFRTGEVTLRMVSTKPDERLDATMAALWAGKKIEAIKQYRIAFGCGLADAKEYVEGLMISTGLGYRTETGVQFHCAQPSAW